jgi:hypothetical protein
MGQKAQKWLEIAAGSILDKPKVLNDPRGEIGL